jgi:hypothetical protein
MERSSAVAFASARATAKFGSFVCARRIASSSVMINGAPDRAPATVCGGALCAKQRSDSRQRTMHPTQHPNRTW